MVVAQFKGAAALPFFHCNGVILRPVGADEFIPQAVKAVRLKIPGKILEAELFIKKIMFYNAVFIGRTGAVHAHLEILVVYHDMVEGELTIGKNAQLAHSVAVVFKLHIPQLHRILQRDGKLLACRNVLIFAFIYRIGHAVAAAILRFLQALAHGLPGNAPVIPVRIVSYVHIMSGTVHRNAVSPEAGDSVVFRRFVKHIAACRMIHHRTHILQSQVIGPGGGQVHSVNHIFSFFIVKMSVLHICSHLRILCAHAAFAARIVRRKGAA